MSNTAATTNKRAALSLFRKLVKQIETGQATCEGVGIEYDMPHPAIYTRMITGYFVRIQVVRPIPRVRKKVTKRKPVRKPKKAQKTRK